MCVCVCVCVCVCAVLCLVAQLSLTLCDSMDYRPPGSSVHGDSPGKNTGVGCHSLLQGIFPIRDLNPGLPHCRQILYHLGHQRSPFIHTHTHTHVTLCSMQYLSSPTRGDLCLLQWKCGFLTTGLSGNSLG